MMNLYLKHPRSNKPDVALTISMVSVIVVLIKFLFSGINIKYLGIDFGTIDAGVVAAILTPTLGSYVARKITSNPDKKETNNE